MSTGKVGTDMAVLGVGREGRPAEEAGTSCKDWKGASNLCDTTV